MPTSLTERQVERRDRLVDAGIAIMGQAANQRVTLRAVLRDTKLTERYFYESFDSVDDFVVAVYDEVGARAVNTLVRAGELDSGGTTQEGIRAAIHAFVGMCDDRPELIRSLLLAPFREPALSMRGLTQSEQFIDLAGQTLRRVRNSGERRLIASGNIGALTAVFIQYLDGQPPFSRVQLIRYCCELVGITA